MKYSFKKANGILKKNLDYLKSLKIWKPKKQVLESVLFYNQIRVHLQNQINLKKKKKKNIHTFPLPTIKTIKKLRFRFPIHKKQLPNFYSIDY